MKTPNLRTRQRGVTLVIAMIMLILVSMLAAAAYLMSTGEARTASGWSDRQRAVFLAENALKTAESAVGTLVANQTDVANVVASQGSTAGYYLRSDTVHRVPTLNPWPASGTVAVSTPIDGKTATAHYIVIYEGKAPAFGERLPSTRSLRSRFTLVAQAGGLKPETNVVLSVSREY